MVSDRLRVLATLCISACVLMMTVSCGSSSGSASPVPAGTSEAQTFADVKPCSINSGYPGDDQCMQAPDPAAGFQFHYGPANYTDPNEVAKYILMPNQEVTDCVFFETPNTEDVFFNEYHSRLRPGSHHMLLYIQDQTVMQDGPGPCNQLLSRNLFGATSPTMDVTDASSAPENAGLAARIPAKQQVVMQMHVINTGSKPILREGWANVMFVPKSSVKIVGDPIFFLGGVAMSIPVGTTVTNRGTAPVPSNADPNNFRLTVAIPHYHAHTTRFTAYAVQGGVKTKILEQYGVLGVAGDPVLVTFDSLTKNQPINAKAAVPGAYTGDVYLKQGDSIEWECVQTNDGKGINGAPSTKALTFVEEAYTGEMCNLFGMYAPSTDPTGDGTWSSVLNP